MLAEIHLALSVNIDRLQAYADSIEQHLRPVPLLRPTETRAFLRYRNADQLVAARRLGVEQPVTQESLHIHLTEGRLLELVDNRYWVLRESRYGVPIAVPSVKALLDDLAGRFQARLAEMGLPPMRLEVTSVLRTAADQAELRRVNPNAAVGESTHQYGTTVDVTYASYRAPSESRVFFDIRGHEWMEPQLRRIESMAAEAGAARMNLELDAILGRILIEMQDEGLVMVTREVLQPVYHLTVARDLVP